MSVTSISFTDAAPSCVVERGDDGSESRKYKICLCVTVSSVCDGPILIKQGLAFFGFGLGSFYQYKFEQDIQAIATKVGPPKRTKNCKVFTVCVEYEYNSLTLDDNGDPVEEPEDIPKTILTEYQEIEEIDETNWVFEGGCDKDGNELPFGLGAAGPSIKVVALPNPANDNCGPITNSAGCKVEKLVRRTISFYRVTTYHSTYNCNWDFFENAINDSPITLYESDQFGIKFLCTLPACTVRLEGRPQKTNIRTDDGLLYFCLQWVLRHDPKGYECKILDCGTQAAFVVGAQDPALFDPENPSAGYPEIISQDERIERCPTGKRDLVNCNGQPVSGKVPLNGQGVEQFIPNGNGTPAPIFLRWRNKATEKRDFGNLPICPPLGP